MHPQVVIKYINELKTIELDIIAEKYARLEKNADVMTATYGTSHRLRRLKSSGACPASANECSVREEVKRKERPDATDDRKINAVTTTGRTGMPLLLTATR